MADGQILIYRSQLKKLEITKRCISFQRILLHKLSGRVIEFKCFEIL
jgi:hypothetical protein